jgi:hypothetical protein
VAQAEWEDAGDGLDLGVGHRGEAASDPRRRAKGRHRGLRIGHGTLEDGRDAQVVGRARLRPVGQGRILGRGADDEDDELGRTLARDVGRDPERLRRVIEMGGEPTGVDRSQGVQGELELGHDAEISTAPAKRPEQLRVPILAGDHDAAIRGDDHGPHQVVAGQAGRSHEESQAARQREPTDAGVAERAAGRGQALRGRRAVHVLPQRPAARPGAPPLRVDGDRAHLTQVDDQRSVGHRMARDPVTAATHRDRQAGSSRGPHRRDDVFSGATRDDHRRMAVDHAVEGLPRGVISLVPGAHDRAAVRIKARERVRPCHP